MISEHEKDEGFVAALDILVCEFGYEAELVNLFGDMLFTASRKDSLKTWKTMRWLDKSTLLGVFSRWLEGKSGVEIPTDQEARKQLRARYYLQAQTGNG